MIAVRLTLCHFMEHLWLTWRFVCVWSIWTAGTQQRFGLELIAQESGSHFQKNQRANTSRYHEQNHACGSLPIDNC